MFTSKVWRVIACGLIGLGAVAVVLSIGQTRVRASTHAESSVTAPDGNGGATVQGISAGGNHVCAQMSNGRLLCWGSNSSGHLGDGTTTPRFMPVDVVSVTSGAGSVVAGGMMSCAIINGGVKCWGANNVGQLGTGNLTGSSVPTDVVGLSSGVTTVGLGANHACAVADGAARCWGYNLDGQLGTGNNSNTTVPTDVVGLSSGVTAIDGGSNHSCAIVDGGAKCWGANGSGQLGRGSNSPSSVPVDVSGLIGGSNVTSIAAGGEHSCAIVAGAVKCWGSNQYGQLGTGNITNTTAPTDVIGLSSGVTSIAAGGWHSCVLTSGGGVKCWGRNDVGQLGISSTQSISVPTDVVGLTSGVTAITAGGISAGTSSTCALLNTGAVKCWGNAVVLGDGVANDNARTPRDVLGLPEYCIFTTAFGNDWANVRNWSNCGGTSPQPGDSAVIGRPYASGLIPQVYATTTVVLNRLRVIGSLNLLGPLTANHVFNDNPGNINLNVQANYQLYLFNSASLTVTQRLTWSLGYASSDSGAFVIPPGATANIIGATPTTNNVFYARIRNYGTVNIGQAQMGAHWTNEASGVMNFNGGVKVGTSGAFTNRGVANISGTNSLVTVYQYSGTLNVNGIVTRTGNFFGMYLYGGVLNGTGIISDAVDNIGGVVAPGGLNHAGSLTIGDYYRQSPTATLSIDIGGSITGTFDQLNVANTGEQQFYPGRADLTGTLVMNQLNGFTPQSGAELRFMKFNVRNGWFGVVNNAFAPAFIPAAYATYAALIEGSSANVRLSAKADIYSVQSGVNNGYTLAFENPFNQAVTLQAVTHTLPISITYRPGTSSGGAGDPTITTINGRQQLRWNLAQPIGAVSVSTFKFGVAVNPSATIGTYTSTIAAHTSANVQDVSLPGAAAMLIQVPTTVSNTFTLPGTVMPRPGLPPLINVRRGNSDEPFLVQTYLACPPGKTCNDPNTDLFLVTLKVAGFSYTMTAGIAPPTPTLQLASLRAPVAKQSPENIEIAS
ncbi:MAG: hypothetical protein HY870_15730, partial [Chloroflexi bacterium]|nr:hypothetical protein [Chloroflexota bacterium]